VIGQFFYDTIGKLEEMEDLLDGFLKAVGIKSDSDSICETLGVEPQMISAYQCSVHREHIGEDQNAALPEFVAGGNSKFGISANQLKERMVCCNDEALRTLVYSARLEKSGTDGFLPYCCQTKESSCPGSNRDLSYNNVVEPFNGVCYVEGDLVDEKISPRDPDRGDTRSPQQGREGVTASIVIIACIVFTFVYFKLKTKFSLQRRDRLRKRLIRGLENIDKVT
tara:strand:+ start:3906 stop:4577 length:672 start_codon:yes stop_codon:yes gene_type:complete